MAQLTIRNLDEAVMQALKKRAGEAGRSTEEEARRCLAAAVGLDREVAIERLRELRKRIVAIPGEPDAAELVRQMRDERAHRWDDTGSQAHRDPSTANRQPG